MTNDYTEELKAAADRTKPREVVVPQSGQKPHYHQSQQISVEDFNARNVEWMQKVQAEIDKKRSAAAGLYPPF